MAKAAGRDCVIKKNSTTIGGGRTVSMTVNGSPIDVTDQGDSGFATMLPDTLIGRQIELTIDGYEEDQVLRDIALATTSADKFMTDITFEFPGTPTDEISGSFVLTSYSETGPYEDGQTFNATFSSDGQWTYTPGV
jgi:predicted secreted protein